MITLSSQPPVPPTQEEVLALQVATKAKLLLGSPQRMYSQWAAGLRSIWEAKDPQAVITALGTNAAEIFSMSADFGELLEKHRPGITTSVISLVKPFTVNQDGTITVNN